jgi:hypothetical protein
VLQGRSRLLSSRPLRPSLLIRAVRRYRRGGIPAVLGHKPRLTSAAGAVDGNKFLFSGSSAALALNLHRTSDPEDMKKIRR